MKKKTIYEIKGLYRDSFRITGFEFGKGKKSLCIVGSMRKFSSYTVGPSLLKNSGSLRKKGAFARMSKY